MPNLTGTSGYLMDWVSTDPPSTTDNDTSGSLGDFLDDMATNDPGYIKQNNTTLLVQLSKQYQNVHGYLALIVCIFGILSNILNIIVLTRKHMRSPTNFILTALAIADMLTMCSYINIAIYMYIVSRPDCDAHTYHGRGWMIVIMVNNLFVITCHMLAMWLTVSLAVFRYIFVCRHQLASVMCSMRRAQLTVLGIVIATIVLCTPYFFLYQVKNLHDNSTLPPCYWIINSNFAANNPLYINFVSWLFGVVIKILPCILLAYLSTLLLIAMQKAKKRRARLLNNISRVMDHDSSSNEHNRTTMMLVGVVICFIVTEMPQGIAAWMAGVSTTFFEKVYIHLGDLMDILVLINSSVNFLLYCTMSQQFRDTFKNLFVTKNFPPFFHRVKHQPNGAEYSMVRTETTHV